MSGSPVHPNFRDDGLDVGTIAEPARSVIRPIRPGIITHMLSLHPLLENRRSTRAFDPSGEVTSEELAGLLEAARWTPSSGNSQPWRFVVGRREDETHKRIFATLAGGDQRWAGRAPLLLVAGHLTRSPSGAPLQHAALDLGQAVACLTLQATALGLSLQQVTGFDPDTLHSELRLPDDVRAALVIAVGRPGDPATLPEDLRRREGAPRTRHRTAALLLS